MHKLLIIIALLLITTCTGCRTESSDPVPKQERYQRLAMEDAAVNNEITLVNIKTSIRQGESGYLTIHGKPGKVYTVATTFRREGKAFVTTISSKAGSDGLVTWNWEVVPGTQPGSYPITVSGGNEKLTTVYTVVAA